MTEPLALGRARPGDGGAATESAALGSAAGPATPQPEVAPPLAARQVLEGSGGWFAVRDERTGELVGLTPGELDRLDASRRVSRARSARVLIERHLPNGAVQIDLPEDFSSALYGWIDERGELRTGHRPPAAASDRRAASGLPGGER